MVHPYNVDNPMVAPLRRADGTLDTTAYEAIARRERARFIKARWSVLRHILKDTTLTSPAARTISTSACQTAR